MKKLEPLFRVAYNKNLLGSDIAYLLDIIIDTYNDYLSEYKKRNETSNQPIKWYGKIRISYNDLCAITGWYKSKLQSKFPLLFNGVKLKDGTIFHFLIADTKENGQKNGLYSINIDELKRFDKYCENYVTEWHRDNEMWEINNNGTAFKPTDISKTIAKDNYNMIWHRYKCKVNMNDK